MTIFLGRCAVSDFLRHGARDARRVMATGLCLVILALSVLVMPVADARAETPAEFARRIEDAYKADNKKAALWDLFYTAGGLDMTAYGLLVETVEKLDLLAPPVEVLVEPLTPDEDVVEKLDGFVYFQNLEPVGAINIFNAKEPQRIIRQYYGRHEGVLYLTATIKQKDMMRPKKIDPDNWFYRRNRGQAQNPLGVKDEE